MPSRPTARCCRAARHIRTPLDNLWITDSALAIAFERYTHVSRMARRKSSSLPGPLENRRRLGKRRMTGLYSADFQPTLPPWLIEYPVDLTQWKWTAPTPPDMRRKNEEGQAVAAEERSSRSLLSWMEQWLPPEAEPVSERRIDKGEEAVLETADNLPERLRVAFEASSTPSSSAAPHPDFVHAMDTLQQDLYLGLIPVEVLFEVLETLPLPLPASKKLAAKTHEMFCAAIVNGLAFSRVQSLRLAGPGLCNLLLETMSRATPTTKTAQTFQLVLAAVPEGYISEMVNGIQSFLRAWFAAPSGTRRSSIDTIAGAISELTPGKHFWLIEAIEPILHESCSKPCNETYADQRRLSWLGLLARIPYVDQSFFVEACARSRYFDSMSKLKEKRLGGLLIRQWTSRGYLRNSIAVQDAWARRNSGVSLGALAWYVSELEPPGPGSKFRKGLIMSYLAVLRRLGLTGRFMNSFELFCSSRPVLSVSPLKLIAVTSRDHRTALEMYRLLKRHRAKLPQGWRTWWTWKAWAPYIKDMILDKDVDRRVIWEVVHTMGLDELEGGGQGKGDGETRRQKHQLLANMAVWFSQAQHLSDRAMVRNVSRCNAWLRSQGQPVGPSGALALMRSVMRELKRAEPGRMERMNWALDVVKDTVGPEEAERTAEVLHKWRRNNAGMAKSVVQ